MRYILILLPFAVAGCAYPAGYGYNYPGYTYSGQAPQYAAGPGYCGQGYYGPPAAPGYGYEPGAYSAVAAGGTENCGTPFEFRACPPLPRRPLAYYPANRS